MKILIIVAFHFITISLFAQSSISRTKWGHIDNPQALDIILEFRNDSVVATSAEGLELEVMYFSQAKDTLKLRKLNGQSPCDYPTEGFYHLKWAGDGDKLLLHTIRNDCTVRSKSITSCVAFFRVKD
jgi:cell wall-associated protease